MSKTKTRPEQAKNNYYFKAYTTTAQVMTTLVAEIIEYDLEDYDPSSDFNTTTHLYTCPVDGVYMFVGSYRLDNLGGTDDTQIALRVNGSIIASSYYSNATGGNEDTVIQVAYIGYLSANDTVAIWGTQDSGGDLSTNPSIADTFFTGALVSGV